MNLLWNVLVEVERLVDVDIVIIHQNMTSVRFRIGHFSAHGGQLPIHHFTRQLRELQIDTETAIGFRLKRPMYVRVIRSGQGNLHGRRAGLIVTGDMPAVDAMVAAEIGMESYPIQRRGIDRCENWSMLRFVMMNMMMYED